MQVSSAAQPSGSLEDAPLNAFHKHLAIYSAGGPFLDGYILSIIGVALTQITPSLHLTTFEEGLTGAAALIGMFFGAYLGGVLTDLFGRQTLYTWDLLALILCSAAQFWVDSVTSLVTLRLLIGVAVGADYPIATSLLTEFAPRRYRGPLLGLLVTMWYAGAAVAYLIGEWLLQLGPDGWRWMLASAALPATAVMLLRHGTPESPRWLMEKGRVAEAEAVLKQVYGEKVATTPPRAGVADEGVRSSALFRSGYGGRVLFVATFWICSIVPMFAVYAFGPKILSAMRLAGAWSHVGSMLITGLFAVGCVLSLWGINRCGRRWLVLHSFFWSGLALLMLGLFPASSPMVTLFWFSAYAILIGGTQILQWIYPNELFPTAIRGAAVGLTASLSRIGAAAGTFLAPFAIERVGIGATILIGAGITFCGFVVCLWAAPETRHLGLEQSAALLEK
ncbi:MAG TPA: MFS transporter [Steroidobacteraceae bacterium]|nr:MFS transporter [Steroidobacteraceae bacterium]